MGAENGVEAEQGPVVTITTNACSLPRRLRRFSLEAAVAGVTKQPQCSRTPSCGLCAFAATSLRASSSHPLRQSAAIPVSVSSTAIIHRGRLFDTNPENGTPHSEQGGTHIKPDAARLVNFII